MSKCFVIQPFDRGRFDKRYSDVFAPAIIDAGLDPYRVDDDPSASIPIEHIQNGIRDSIVCFSDITLDNPNVWFELGYAIASRKDLCLVCSNERDKKYPFDVQHRNIISYNTESVSDFSLLRRKISERLSAIKNTAEELEAISVDQFVKEHSELSQHAINTLSSIAEHQYGVEDFVSHGVLRGQMEDLGYNNIAAIVGIRDLLKRKFITSDNKFDGDEIYVAYTISELGMDWLLKNHDLINLEARRKIRSRKPHKDDDDDIPF